MKLLLPDEQQMIKGLVINKFRGDVSILKPGLKMIEEKTGIPVVGVIPMEKIDLDDEDSLSDRLAQTAAGEGVDVAVVHLPHISNFTDFSRLKGSTAFPAVCAAGRAAWRAGPDPAAGDEKYHG